MKTENSTIMRIAESEYYREFDRKTRIESKATGYLTVVSILLASAIGLLVFIVSTDIDTKYKTVLYLLLFIEFYFSLWAIGFALKSQKTRILGNFSFDELERVLYEENNEKVIFYSLSSMTKENIEFNNELQEDIGISYIFVIITIVVFVAIFCISIILLGGSL